MSARRSASPKRFSSQRSNYRSLKKMSLNSENKVRNSPVKSMNGLSLNQLEKNDEVIDIKLRNCFRKIDELSKEIEKKNLSNSIDEENFCIYLKTNLSRKKMKRLFTVLLLKNRYSDEKDMNELCEELKRFRPDLMRPRILNLIVGIINLVFNQTAIMIFLMSTGIIYLICKDEIIPEQIKNVLPFSLEKVKSKIEDLFKLSSSGKDNLTSKVNIMINHGNKVIEKASEFAQPLLNYMTKKVAEETTDEATQTVRGVIKNISNIDDNLITSLRAGAASATVYNFIRVGTYFMPRGFRLGNRSRAVQSARRVIGDTRKN